MNKTEELFSEIDDLFNDFKTNHESFREKGVKAAAQRARKAIGGIKKLITEYRKASVEESKK